MSNRTTRWALRRIFIDKQSLNAFHALVQTAEAVRTAASAAGLCRTVAELINLRMSQRLPPRFDVHTKPALRAGESPRRLGVLAAWWTPACSPVMSARR
ncbi:carboxymuconolactone decarboxylase family protein [Streptomyces sp. NPDC005181]|uniref:carboxymuconolactone decarboxylase family protein n=1 Tax=Streptomyces sp. NPDC005181 TaxID=3156869 RepID=UPI0033B6637B